MICLNYDGLKFKYNCNYNCKTCEYYIPTLPQHYEEGEIMEVKNY